jgi:hypothetical protein
MPRTVNFIFHVRPANQHTLTGVTVCKRRLYVREYEREQREAYAYIAV